MYQYECISCMKFPELSKCNDIWYDDSNGIWLCEMGFEDPILERVKDLTDKDVSMINDFWYEDNVWKGK